MYNRDITLGSLINLVTLVAGIGVGFMLGALHGQQKVLAQATPKIEEVPVGISMPSLNSHVKDFS